MSARSDSLRQTLDTLSLSEDTVDDRRYLVSMLRRLGYTEAEIAAELGDLTEYAPVVQRHDDFDAVEEPSVAHGTRLVEVEYIPPDEDDFPGDEAVAEFEPVYKDDTELLFRRYDPNRDLIDFQRQRRIRLRVVRAGSAEDAELLARDEGLDVIKAVPVHIEKPAWEDTQAWAEVDESGAAGRHSEPVEWESWDETEAPAAKAAPAPASGAPYQHKDYTLHTREVKLSGDRTQRIYFFAKGRPKSGEPCPMPKGYVVRENDKTGLPYLAKEDK